MNNELRAGYPPTLRVHGELVPVVGTESLTDSEISGLILSILTPVQKSVLENNFELDFAIPFQNKARFRVNVFKEQGHLGVSLRLIPLLIPAMESLGLPPVVSKLTSLRQGLVLVTGPTGHGKSTTLAAMINQINMERDIAKLVQDNISMKKEKIEYEIEKLIRAYDPCMSCASHFLKVNWM